MVDIVFSFDMTLSMTPCIFQTRQELNRLMGQLFGQLSDLRIGLIVHGDYDSSRYLTKHMDLTSDEKTVRDFVVNVPDAGSNYWNEGEAYEQVLKLAKTLSWRPNVTKALVVLGDDIPHPPVSSINKDGVDWRKKLKDLEGSNINVYGVQCPTLDGNRSKFFYQELSRKTLNGSFIRLNQFSYVTDLIIALSYKQHNDDTLEQYEKTMEDEGRYNRNMEEVFNALLDREDQKKMVRSSSTTISNVDYDDAGDLVPVPPSRFQVLNVKEDISIKQFVIQSGATFKTGRGFYELTKRELVSDKKEVVLHHTKSGDMFTGAEARHLLKLPKIGRIHIKPVNVPDGYTAFIQSTSYNRKLKANTKFLYEI